MRQGGTIWIAVFCVALLSACSPVKLPDVNYYTLANLTTPVVRHHERSQASLMVTSSPAEPGYESSDMVYMMIPYQLNSFVKHKWVAPPTQMLLPLVVQAIRHQAYFKAVVSAPSSVMTDYRLDLTLVKLQQEFLLPTSQLRMVVQAVLLSNKTSQIVASQRFAAVISAQDHSPYAGVLAANQAASIISRALARFCLHYVP